NRHDGNAAIILHTGTAYPMGASKAIDQAICKKIRWNAFGFCEPCLRRPLRHAKRQTHGGYGVGVFFRPRFAVFLGGGSCAGRRARKGLYIMYYVLRAYECGQKNETA